MPQVTRALALLSFTVALAAHAGPYTVEECVAASGAAQEHQKNGALSAAKQALERCADATCPGMVQAECTRWLDEVLAAMPTITIAVRLDGVDQPRARVFLDEKPWLEELTGHPVPIDPGEHLLTVSVGARQQEQRLLINVGEKNRLVVFQLRGTPEPAPVAPPTPTPVVTQPAPGRGFPALATAMTATAVVGLGLFVGLGLSGRSSLDQLLADPCAETKTCDPARVSSIQARFLAADISLGVGIAAALVAGWQWWRWAAEEPAVTPAVLLLPGGAAVSVTGAW
jgi:hypothetical protein